MDRKDIIVALGFFLAALLIGFLISNYSHHKSDEWSRDLESSESVDQVLSENIDNIKKESDSSNQNKPKNSELESYLECKQKGKEFVHYRDDSLCFKFVELFIDTNYLVNCYVLSTRNDSLIYWFSELGHPDRNFLNHFTDFQLVYSDDKPYFFIDIFSAGGSSGNHFKSYTFIDLNSFDLAFETEHNISLNYRYYGGFRTFKFKSGINDSLNNLRDFANKKFKIYLTEKEKKDRKKYYSYDLGLRLEENNPGILDKVDSIKNKPFEFKILKDKFNSRSSETINWFLDSFRDIKENTDGRYIVGSSNKGNTFCYDTKEKVFFPIYAPQSQYDYLYEIENISPGVFILDNRYRLVIHEKTFTLENIRELE